METTTSKVKPYEGRAAVTAIVGLAKRSTHVTWRASGDYHRFRGSVTATIGGMGHLLPSDYDRPNDKGVYPHHKATTVTFSNGTDDEAKLATAMAGFESELKAAGWEVVKHGPWNWVVVGPLWKEWMRGVYDDTKADKLATEDRNAKAVREADEISRLLESRGVTGKHVESHGSARVTLYLDDIRKLIGDAA